MLHSSLYQWDAGLLQPWNIAKLTIVLSSVSWLSKYSPSFECLQLLHNMVPLRKCFLKDIEYTSNNLMLYMIQGSTNWRRYSTRKPNPNNTTTMILEKDNRKRVCFGVDECLFQKENEEEEVKGELCKCSRLSAVTLTLLPAHIERYII